MAKDETIWVSIMITIVGYIYLNAGVHNGIQKRKNLMVIWKLSNTDLKKTTNIYPVIIIGNKPKCNQIVDGRKFPFVQDF